MKIGCLPLTALLLLSSSVFAGDEKVDFNCEITAEVRNWAYIAGVSDLLHVQAADLVDCKKQASSLLGKFRKTEFLWSYLNTINTVRFVFVAPDRTTKGTITKDGDKAAVTSEYWVGIGIVQRVR